MVGVCKEQKPSEIQYGSRPDRTYLFKRIEQRNSVDCGRGYLFQEVAVRAGPQVLVDVVAKSGVDVNGLASLCGMQSGGGRRFVIGRVPQVMDAPTGLDAFGRQNCDGVIVMA